MNEFNTFMALEKSNIDAFELDLVTGIYKCTAGWAKLVGLDGNGQSFSKEAWEARVHPDDIDAVRAADQAMFDGTTDRSKNTFRFKTADGDWVWIQSNIGVSEWGSDGEPVKIMGTNTDVTEFIDREQAKDDYLANISHELRTPLTSILGALKMANSGQLGELPGPVANLLELAQRNSNRLLQMVNEILDFRAIETGEMFFDLAKHSANDIASDAVQSIQGYVQDGQKIVVSGEQDADLFVNVDVNRVQQILTNLLSNAIKFSPANSEVSLQVLAADGNVEFRVRDHGPGVPAELEGKMFQRFTQAHSSEKKKFSSTGLGLSICKQMTDGMGGEIGYFNNDDDGATFWVRFPEAQDA